MFEISIVIWKYELCQMVKIDSIEFVCIEVCVYYSGCSQNFHFTVILICTKFSLKTRKIDFQLYFWIHWYNNWHTSWYHIWFIFVSYENKCTYIVSVIQHSSWCNGFSWIKKQQTLTTNYPQSFGFFCE